MSKIHTILVSSLLTLSIGCAEVPSEGSETGGSEESESGELREFEETGLDDPWQCLHYQIVELGLCSLECEDDERPCYEFLCQASCELSFYSAVVNVCEFTDRVYLCNLDALPEQIECLEFTIGECGEGCGAVCFACDQASC